MITIKEIARLAGTSRGTVDRVLHGRGSVNPDLAKRIIEIASENDYHSNPFARGLVKSGQKNVIGVVINSKGNIFFDDVLAGINEAIHQYQGYGLDILIKEIKGYNENEQLDALAELLENDIAGLAITPIDTPAVTEKLASLAPLPIVTFNSDLHFEDKLAFIGCDYVNSGNLCGDIVNLAMPDGGRVSIVTGSFKMKGHNQRIKGFSETVSRNPNIKIVSTDENNDDNEVSYKVTTQVIEKYNPDLIYFCAAGTEGGVNAVKESGRAVRVVVVDDIPPMRKYLAEGTIIAMVTQQPYQQGYRMVRTLYEKLILNVDPENVYNYVENRVRLKHSKGYRWK